MRDYKNVKVPKKYRAAAARTGQTTIKRTGVRKTARTRVPKAGEVLLKLFLAIMAAGACFFGWQTYQWTERSGVFEVTGVDIQGVRHLVEEDFTTIAGVFTGQNIFRADIQGAARRARENPWVREVRIHRRLPNRISMVIEERVPAAIVDTGKGRFLVDGDGMVIERMSTDTGPWQLPRVVMHGASVRPGEQVSGEELAESLALVAELSARGGWRLADVTVKADSLSQLAIVYAGHEIRIGSGEHGEKLRRLGEIMEDVSLRGIRFTYVDLRPERQAAVMVVKDRVKGPGSGGRGGRL